MDGESPLPHSREDRQTPRIDNNIAFIVTIDSIRALDISSTSCFCMSAFSNKMYTNYLRFLLFLDSSHPIKFQDILKTVGISKVSILSVHSIELYCMAFF